MRILAIDPGTTESAILFWDGERIEHPQILSNVDLIGWLRQWPFDHMAIEMVESFGMPVGREVFETVLWIGRFIQEPSCDHTLVYRKQVKLHLCGTPRAKDPNVRAALIDRFGGSKQAAVGTKKNPGPCHGIKSHLWSALAVAVTFTESEEFSCPSLP